MIIFWAVVFLISLAVLVKGSDVLLNSAERIGLALGLSPFIVGVVIIGFGTSLPELASSLAGVLRGAGEIVVANVVGSNIANILLIAGAAAIAGGRLTVSKNLIDLDIPMLAIATTFLIAVSYDARVTIAEAVFLLLAGCVYLFYTFQHKEEKLEQGEEVIKEFEREHGTRVSEHFPNRIAAHDIILLCVGLAALIVGARFLVDAVIALSGLLNIGVGVISLIAVAAGTSMPELVVSIRAGLRGKADVSLGNIFGSSVFNVLFVVGIPGLFSTLVVDAQTLSIGLPVMVAATILFLISTLSNQIYKYEGAMYVLLYVLFLGKVAKLL